MKNKPYPLYELPRIKDLKDMIRKRAEEEPEAIAFSYTKGKDEMISKTSAEFSSDIDALGTYLFSLGLQGKHIAILGENSYEWIVAFCAIVNGGGVAVPIDKEQPPETVCELLKQNDCTTIIYSRTYENSVSQCNIEKLSMEDFDEFISKGRELIPNNSSEYINYKVDRSAPAAIFFTSGTTGKCKGVMLSQKNMAADINSACKNFFLSGDTVAVLPFHHTFGLITAVFMPFNYRHMVFLNKSLKRIQNDFALVKPQTVFFVPLFVETFYKQIWLTAKKNGKNQTIRRAMRLSDFLLKIGIDIRKRLFSSVHSAFGGNLEYIICGGAALNEKYIKEFRSWGISILNGYGITECSPVVAVNRNKYRRDGSVGYIIDCCTVRTNDEKEVLVKGDNVMLGYYNDKQATDNAFADGWYNTGDLGYIEDGFLFLTGRKKNLIILSNGENISPEEIETRLLSFDEVREVVVYSDGGILTAEIYPSEEYMGRQDHFNELLKTFNREQPLYKQINKIKLRDVEFEKNSTKKILRYKVMEANDERQN